MKLACPLIWQVLLFLQAQQVLLPAADSVQRPVVFPSTHWSRIEPRELGMDAVRLEELAARLGGRGCVIKDGHMVKQWGDVTQVRDILSSAKPVLSTLLFFAVEEGLVKGVDQPVADFGWPLRAKDRGITFRHLGAMTSGYARPEGPGEAWAYNDFAIQLYQRTLFDKVYQSDAKSIAEAPQRLGALGFEDGLKFSEKRRLSVSVRDFARIAWFWANDGRWNGRQLLPGKYFDEFRRPQTPSPLPVSREAATEDYLGIGSFGGGSEHFTRFGPGVYGFNWWFNGTGDAHPASPTWPDAPPETFMSIGAGGNNAAILPEQRVVLVAMGADWNELKAGDPSSKINQALKLLVSVLPPTGARINGKK